jgi:hypothetical protein
VEFTFFQEVDDRARMLQNVKGRDIMVIPFEESAMVTAMTAQSRGQGRFRAAHIHKLATWRGNAVEASKEGLRGGRVLEIRGRSGHCESGSGHSPKLLLST